MIDHDRIEPHNLLRQNFYAEDLGKFKSQVIAERLSRRYGRKIAYFVQPFDEDLRDSGNEHFSTSLSAGIIVGCVDNPQARKTIARSLRFNSWWLDIGNSYNSGQVLLGNIPDTANLKETFDERLQLCRGLPIPSLQQPSLLIPAHVEIPIDCAQAVNNNTQSPVINQAMAMFALEFIRRMLKQDLPYMGAYLDLDAGTLKMVPADPVTVARMFSLKEDFLITDRITQRKVKHGDPKTRKPKPGTRRAKAHRAGRR